MTLRVNGRVARRTAIVGLVLLSTMVALMWSGMLNGAGAVSAFGDVDSDDLGNGAIQDQYQAPPINLCRLPPEPCG